MKNHNVFPLNIAVVTILAVISVFAAFSWGQTAQQADSRADSVASPAAGEGVTAPASTTASVPVETTSRDMAQSNARRIPARASDRRNVAQAVKNRRTSAPAAESDTSAAPATGDAVSEPAAKAAALLPIIPSGDPATGGGMSVPPALLDNSGVTSPTDNSSNKSAAAKTADLPRVEHAETVPAETDYSMYKAVGGFGLVLSLIALGYFGARKYFPQHFTRRTSDRNLKLIETLAIGEKRSVAVIEFDNQRFIIGNTPNQITLLAALPAKASFAEESRPASASSFELSKAKVASDTFRSLYEVEKTNGVGTRKPLPPDIRAKMRQLRESLES